MYIGNVNANTNKGHKFWFDKKVYMAQVYINMCVYGCGGPIQKQIFYQDCCDTYSHTNIRLIFFCSGWMGE